MNLNNTEIVMSSWNVTSINQNKMHQHSFDSKYIQNTFNLALGVNNYALKNLVKENIVNIGWNRCRIHEDYVIVRCFKCTY